MVKKNPERRKHPRFAIQEDSLLLTATLFDNIIDISIGGFSCSYEKKSIPCWLVGAD